MNVATGTPSPPPPAAAAAAATNNPPPRAPQPRVPSSCSSTSSSASLLHSLFSRELGIPPPPLLRRHLNHHHHLQQQQQKLLPSSPEILNPGYRILVRKLFRRLAPRPVFRTPVSNESSNGSSSQQISYDDPSCNPVYDLEYSPVVFPGHRVIAVGDEHGYLSIVRVGLEGAAKYRVRNFKGEQQQQQQQQRQISNGCAVTVGPGLPNSIAAAAADNNNESNSNSGGGGLSPPVLLTLSWSPFTGDKIVTGYGDGSIRVWDVGKGLPTLTTFFYAHEKSIKRVAWRSHEVLISCSRTNEISVYDNRMRNPLANRIDCNALNSRLTDVCVLSENYVSSCSSNSGSVLLWDLRKSYKLYRRVKPVQMFRFDDALGNVTMQRDVVADDGAVYVLGSDSVVRGFDWRESSGGNAATATSSAIVTTTKSPGNSNSSSQVHVSSSSSPLIGSYQVPGPVDFFTKIDVDRFAGVLVVGGSSGSAFGFDLREPFSSSSSSLSTSSAASSEDDGDEKDDGNSSSNRRRPRPRRRHHQRPFFRLGGESSNNSEEPEDDDFDNKENSVSSISEHHRRESITAGGSFQRTYSAVALGTRRGFDDCSVQIAGGGDDGVVSVWD